LPLPPPPPPRGCLSPFSLYSAKGNGFSQSRNWHVGFDHNVKIVVWEEDEDYWDGLPLDWALDGSFEEEALAIQDAMEEDFFAREDDSTPEVKRLKGATESAKLHKLWRRFSLL